jgi:hypothetical protein
MKDEALKLALEALELSSVTVDSFGVQRKTQEAITAIKQALAAPVQEPVATIDSLEQEIYENTREFVSLNVMEWLLKRLNTAPPNVATPLAAQRQSARSAWVGLTDEEIAMAWPYELGQLEKQFAFNLESKLKEKNSD